MQAKPLPNLPRPQNPKFSSGPTSKRPGWSPANLELDSLGRSHRAALPRARLNAVIEESRAILGIPDDYSVGIVPGSDTGAVEIALWNMLGARGVDILAWESFGAGWVKDVQVLGLEDVRSFEAPYGELPDLRQVSGERDIVFTWNGTTSGVRVPDAEWLPPGPGLAICDATSAAFAMPIDLPKLDVITWSWQKVLGGEAAHGMLALSPRAMERLASYDPPWPLPKLFRLKSGGVISSGLFSGATINTPSLLAVEDQLDALAWARSIGGLDGLIARSEANLAAVADWVDRTDWIDFLAPDPATRSSTSICLAIVDAWFLELDEPGQRAAVKALTGLLERADVAFDIGAYRDAPPGLRLWGGATVEVADIERVLPWLTWAFETVRDDGLS